MNLKKLRNLFSKKQIKKTLVLLPVFKRSLFDTFQSTPALATTVLVVNLLVYVLPIVTTYITGRVIDELNNSVQKNTWTEGLILYIGIFFVVIFVLSVVRLVSNYVDNVFALTYDRLLVVRLVKKFSELDFLYYENSKYNDLLQKAKENIRFNRFLYFRVVLLLANLLSLITVFAFFLAYSPLSILIIILANIPQFLNELFFGASKWGIWDNEGKSHRSYEITKRLLSDQKSLKEVKIFRTRIHLLDLVNNLYKKFNSKQYKVENSRFKFSIILEFFSLAVFLLAYIKITNDVVMGFITLGMFTFYISNLNNLSGNLSSIFRYLASSYEAGLYVRDYYKVLDLEIKVKSGSKRLKYSSTPPTIEFNNVSFKYPGTKKNIFNHFDLTIKPGEHIAIVGENGAGKTTLIALLQRFYDTTSGNILVNNIPLKDIKLDDWYKYLATLSQEYVKYHFSAEKNIYLGDLDNKNRTDNVIKSAKLTGADKFILEYDKKYKQVLNKKFPNGTDPSEGQWQKIALARAFFKDSPILILDEPTSAIDPKAEYEIFQKLFKFAKNKTVIIISHRFSTVRNADRILVLDKGKIVEEGSHKQLIQNNGIYKEAYDLQKKGYEDI